MKQRIPWLLLFLLALPAAAQPVILDVVSTASHIPAGFPSAGIAQGSFFSIVGARLGPDVLQQAPFPLPTTAGLAGVSVQIKVGTTTVNTITVNGIMVYASATEVAAILPSSTPLGSGTVTLNYNGATATAPIQVVASAPGILLAGNSIGYDVATGATALAFNVGADGSLVFNDRARTAQPGQTVIMAATGAGAISGDETQSGITAAPTAALQVFVGNQPATGVSVRRGSYPALPDSLLPFHIPANTAALDMIQFTVPDGVSGCQVSVYVRSGNFVSAPAFLSISPDGGICTQATAVAPGDTVSMEGTAHVANISLNREIDRTALDGDVTEEGSDTGLASFTQYDLFSASPAVPVYAFSEELNLDVGTCNQQMVRVVTPYPLPPVAPAPPGDLNPSKLIYLDAGAALNITGPNGTMQLKQDKGAFYLGSFGRSFQETPSPKTGKLFLDPGTYTIDNGAGGAGVPGFSANLTLTTPQLAFTDIDSFVSIDRTQSLTVHWTGGDPNGYVSIFGSSYNTSPAAGPAAGGAATTIGASFQCSERASAGKFTVPDYVLRNLPPPGPFGFGTLGLHTYVANRFQLDGFDLGLVTFGLSLARDTTYK